MRNNLIDSLPGKDVAAELGRKLPALFRQHRKAMRGGEMRGHTPAEVEVLQALGHGQ